MALDEPQAKDKIIDRGSYQFIVDAQTEDILRQGGGLQIDYVDEDHQKGYLIRLKSAPGGHHECSC